MSSIEYFMRDLFGVNKASPRALLFENHERSYYKISTYPMKCVHGQALYQR